MQILESLEKIDIGLFLLVNQADNSVLDSIMLYASSKFFWIPLYILLVVFISFKYRWKAVLAVLFVLLAVGLADLISVHLFKNVFLRLRPCYNPALEDVINNIVGCGGKYGFVSSHAANSFAIVVMIIKLLGDRQKWLNWFMPLWGILILYSRIYLGKHYPSDVIVGAALGVLVAWLMYLVFEKVMQLRMLNNDSAVANNNN